MSADNQDLKYSTRVALCFVFGRIAPGKKPPSDNWPVRVVVPEVKQLSIKYIYIAFKKPAYNSSKTVVSCVRDPRHNLHNTWV